MKKNKKLKALKAPFYYFGGKANVATRIWQRLGAVNNYVEPFFGSGAILLAAPKPAPVETVNDIDGLICNFWRSVQADPEAVARYTERPTFENDFHAWHAWLLGQRNVLSARLEGNPVFYDTEVAGLWVWGACLWIGSGWCAGDGPWQQIDGLLVNVEDSPEPGIRRARPQLGVGERGLLSCPLPSRIEWLQALAKRLGQVRVCCGDWDRVLGKVPTTEHGLTAVVLDPPYSGEVRLKSLYAKDDPFVAEKVRTWALKHGDNPLFRIVLCGYEGEHDMPSNWECIEWKTSGGYGNQGKGRGRANAKLERLWFSPHCIDPTTTIFSAIT